MHPSQVPERPLIPKLGKLEQAERIYFFERENGDTFFAKSEEAWSIYRGKNQIIGQEKPRIKFVGSSDGSLFRKAVIESQKAFRIEGLEKAQEILRKGEQDELAQARGNMILPPNYDTITHGGRPIDINALR